MKRLSTNGLAWITDTRGVVDTDSDLDGARRCNVGDVWRRSV